MPGFRFKGMLLLLIGVVVGALWSPGADRTSRIERVAGRTDVELARVSSSASPGGAREHLDARFTTRVDERAAVQAAAERAAACAAPRGGQEHARRLRSPPEIAQLGRRYAAFVRAGRFYGSGLVLSERGDILTCQHVVKDLNTVQVTLSDGSEHLASVLDRDTTLDLALLRVQGSFSRDAVATAPLGTAASLRAGDEVYAIGAPRKMSFSLSRGMVTFAERELDGLQYLQTDLPLNPGNSGGPVVNGYGEIVAIASFVLEDSQGLSFALPIQYARARFASLLPTPIEPSVCPP